MNYQRIILAGNATDDAKRQTSKKGDVAYSTFSLGVSDGKEKTTFFPITAFGKTGEVAADYVTGGRAVLVEGRIDVSKSGRFNVIADRVVLGANPAKPTKKKK